MSKKRKNKTKQRSASASSPTIAFLTSSDAYDMLCCDGYTRLDKNPEVLTACRRIAELVSSMTIYLMTNTEKNGDQRIINELSRKVDINPNNFMTRKTWMDAIVMNLILYGSGNSVVLPITSNGILEELLVQDPYSVAFIPDGIGYKLNIGGIEYEPQNILHFVSNPDPHYPWKGMGVTAAVKDVANNLKQAAATEKGFMESKWKPSVIVKVDGMIEEFSSPEGRKKLLKEYVSTNEAGEPWLIPADQFSVEQIRPLSLADLAINETVELDKKTVASILGVPPFVLGVGTYNAKEWDNFISGTIRNYAQIIEQELTKKLLISPKWYWKFNMASLYAYDLKTTADVYSNLYVRGIVDGNEVREKISMSPRDGLEGLVILENYIPLDKVGDQLKLKQEGKDGKTD